MKKISKRYIVIGIVSIFFFGILAEHVWVEHLNPIPGLDESKCQQLWNENKASYGGFINSAYIGIEDGFEIIKIEYDSSLKHHQLESKIMNECKIIQINNKTDGPKIKGAIYEYIQDNKKYLEEYIQ